MKFDIKRRQLLLETGGLVGLLSGCANPPRTQPWVELERDHFGKHLPEPGTVFAQVLAPAPPLADLKFLYLIDHWPSGLSEARVLGHRAALTAALRKVGFSSVLRRDDMRALLLQRGAEFKFEREPRPEELAQLAQEIGPFTVLETSYDFGLRFGLAARDPASGRLQMAAQYTTRVWNDLDNELILPGLNVWANWLHGGIRLRPIGTTRT